MSQNALAGKSAPREILVNIPRLVSSYYRDQPDLNEPAQEVSFGTSGHRGSSFKRSFNEDHIMAITQAISDYRTNKGFDGPLYLGMDTHALSEPAHATALEVLAANGIAVMIQKDNGYTPTPVISHAILTYNRGRRKGLADGIVVTPSHNPPDNGGIKYNSWQGGPAEPEITNWVAYRANMLLSKANRDVKRIPYERALKADTTHNYDYVRPYIEDLNAIVDMDAIQSAGLRIAADAMGGSGLAYWQPIADRYSLNIDVLHDFADPTFGFMTVDKDGRIRMDCSSKYAMAGLIKLKDSYDIAFGNDPDFDRHGIVTRSEGLMNPNHYLAVAIWYLFQHRPGWKRDAAIGKTLVSSSMIDRVAAYMKRNLLEVPVGFKWFVDGLLAGNIGFGGEESAGASFLRRDSIVWTTDKDGFIMDLLAAEILAKTGRDPSEHYRGLEQRFGSPSYERIDAAATQSQKAILKDLAPHQVQNSTLAGEKINAILTNAPGNGAAIGGLKVVAENCWFAARPSGTEDVYKIYAESFLGNDHLKQVQEQARDIINAVFAAAGT